MKIIFNGQLIHEVDFKVGIDNRAFTYGDGVFETIMASNREIFFLEDHLLRLTSGIRALGMNTPDDLNEKFLRKEIEQLIQANHLDKEVRIKIMVWRKTGGLFSPTEKSADYIITAVHQPDFPATKSKAAFFKQIRLSYSPISGFKTLSSLPYIMAGVAKNSLGADELILFDQEGHIAECLTSNIFWISKDMVFTPSTVTGCKEGIMRKQILGHLQKNNIRYHIGKFKEDDLLDADFVFTSNVSGLFPIREIEGKRFQDHSDMFAGINNAVRQMR